MSSTPSLINSAEPISQGAEAKVYKAYLHETTPVLLKHRFRKQYRHPTLDASLTRSRVAGESRALLKCLRAGVNVPGVRMVDVSEGVICIEWIEGESVRKILPGGVEEESDDGADTGNFPKPSHHDLYGLHIDDLMGVIGKEIAKMHHADIIHGDLTTSNMMLEPGKVEGELPRLVLIDFGLSYYSTLVEDKAVDLYVLERAFSSTHPDSEPMFASVLAAYGTQMGKEWPTIKKRLDEVRLRGRKRSMVG